MMNLKSFSAKLLISLILVIIFSFLLNSITSFADQDTENTSLSIILKNQNGDFISNAKFYIKELVLDADGITYLEQDPLDVYGNSIGTEETIDEKIIKTFITDENGKININLRKGKYKVVQLTTAQGHLLNETNEYEIDVEEIHGEIVAAKIEDPVYSAYQRCHSVSTKYAAEGRNDGYSLFYYEDYLTGGKLSLLSSDNVLVDTINTDQVHQIIAAEGAWYCLIEEWRTGIYNIYKIIDKNDKLEVQGKIAEIGKHNSVSFAIDKSTGNFVVAVDEENGNYIDILIYSPEGIQTGMLRITGDGKNYVNSIAVNDNAFYLSAYVYSNHLSANSDNIAVDNPYCILKVSKALSSLEKVRVLSTYSSSDDDQFRRIHKIIDLKDGNLYYIGSFEGTITFPESATTSGKAITLTSKGGEDGVAIKLNSELMIEWATPIGGEGIDHFYDAGITEDGGIVIGGDSELGKLIIDRDDTQAKKEIKTSSITDKAQKWRGVAAKLNSDGKAIWAHEFGYAANEGMYGLAVLNNNSFVLSGFDAEDGGTEGTAAFLRLNEYIAEEANTTPTYLNIENIKETIKDNNKEDNKENSSTAENTPNPPAAQPSDSTPSNTNSEGVNTGDNLVLVTSSIIILIIALNISQIIFSKSKRNVPRIQKTKRK